MNVYEIGKLLFPTKSRIDVSHYITTQLYKVMRTVIFMSLIILTLSCSDDDVNNACTSANLTEDIPWIAELKKSMTNCSCELSLIQGTYNGQIVIFISLTDPLCNGVDVPTLYNCEGKEIRSFSGSADDQKELMDKVTRDRVLFKCKT